MKKIKTLVLFLLLLAINIIVLTLRNPIVILGLFILICMVSAFVTSPSQTFARLRLFMGIAISILFFQMIVVSSMSLEMKIMQTARVAAQLFVVSEVVRVGVQYISPVSLISLFTFLPKNLQLLIAMTFYFIPLTMKEYEIIKHVQISRGLGRTFKSKMIIPIAVIIPLLHRVFQRSEVMTYSILSRGWREV